MTALHDPMQLPLDGIRVVEASAGTGKTFTIATLYLRLVIEQGLLPEEIVVATFTRAATAELSERVRARLALADAMLAGDDPATQVPDDDGDATVVRDTIGHALATGRTLEGLRGHVRKARLALDSAMIGTLHGFCFRALGEFGFETGQALDEPELVEDIRGLELEIVRDFWRRGSADAGTATLLAATWGSPEKLAKQVRDARWRGRGIDVPEPDHDALLASFERARSNIAAWDATTIGTAQAALEACISTPRTVRDRVEALTAVQAWARRGECGDKATSDALGAAWKLDAKALDKLQPKGKHAEGKAFDDLAALCAAHAALDQAARNRDQLPAAHLLRDARRYLETERRQRLAARNLVSHDGAVDTLAAALAVPVRGNAAVARMRARWKAALIDEFQDTDSTQWQVVRRLFGETTLVLVGDPKQAIYGFRGGDVYAWREAVAASREQPLELATSYRSGAAMTRAINALFQRPHAFIEGGFEYTDVGSDPTVATRALLRGGKPLAALQLWWLDPEAIGHAKGRPPSKAHLHPAIERACVAWIKAMLEDPEVQLDRGDGRCARLRPRNLAVLVNSNAEAGSLQAALGRAGVPAASNLRASVYATDEAADLALLLDALAAPDDPRRARAACASVLFGDSATVVATTRVDAPAQAAMLERVAAWVAQVHRDGPLPWLHAMIAGAAPRILAWPDGERRMANYLQLAELLQDLHAGSFGVEDLAARFARARVESDDDADSTRLRIDTDADAVTVSTVHTAKGLEYDVVLVPYAVLAFDPARHAENVPLFWHHDGNQARVAVGEGTPPSIRGDATDEQAAEDVRKFYVAVTRARALCVLPWGPGSSAQFSPVYHLLHRAGHEGILEANAVGCDQALRELCERAGPAAAKVVPLPDAGTSRRRMQAVKQPDTLVALEFSRKTLERDWQTWSFSRLVRGSVHAAVADPLPGTGDTDALPVHGPDSGEPDLGGARFGSVVHAAFETTDFATWRDADDIPIAARASIERWLRAQGLPDRGIPMPAAIASVGNCIRAALNATLPCGVRLCDVAPTERRAEIEFHLTLARAETPALYTLLHRHGYQRERSGVTPQRLYGLLTGKIDLVFAHDGRYHVLDWKTNRCPPYDDAAMRAEIARHDYDLQWLLYTLALHRWLGRRVPDYDYERHVGEVYYLFVRGMADGRGIHVDRPPRELIVAMDALFGGSAA